MSNYVRTSTVEVEFDGDKLTATIKALELGDLLKVQSIDTEVDFLQWAREALPKYIKVDGLRDAAGTDLTIEDVCTSAYFLPLMLELGGHLTETAKLKRP